MGNKLHVVQISIEYDFPKTILRRRYYASDSKRMIRRESGVDSAELILVMRPVCMHDVHIT